MRYSRSSKECSMADQKRNCPTLNRTRKLQGRQSPLLELLMSTVGKGNSTKHSGVVNN